MLNDVFAIVKSGATTVITVESDAVLFPLFDSNCAVVTATWLIFGDVAFAATSTVTVNAGYAADEANTSERVHVGNVVHVQPVPDIAVTVNPDGGASVTDTD